MALWRTRRIGASALVMVVQDAKSSKGQAFEAMWTNGHMFFVQTSVTFSTPLLIFLFFLVPVLVQPLCQPSLFLHFVQTVFCFLNPVLVCLADFHL